MIERPELVICDDLNNTPITPEQREILIRYFTEFKLSLPDNAKIEITQLPINMRKYYD